MGSDMDPIGLGSRPKSARQSSWGCACTPLHPVTFSASVRPRSGGRPDHPGSAPGGVGSMKCSLVRSVSRGRRWSLSCASSAGRAAPRLRSSRSRRRGPTLPPSLPTRDAFRAAVGGGTVAGRQRIVRRPASRDQLGRRARRRSPTRTPARPTSSTSTRRAAPCSARPGTGFLVSANAGGVQPDRCSASRTTSRPSARRSSSPPSTARSPTCCSSCPAPPPRRRPAPSAWSSSTSRWPASRSWSSSMRRTTLIYRATRWSAATRG